MISAASSASPRLLRLRVEFEFIVRFLKPLMQACIGEVQHGDAEELYYLIVIARFYAYTLIAIARFSAILCILNIQLDTAERYDREIAGLLEAMKEYQLDEGYILTENHETEIKLDHNEKKYLVHVLPIWKWLLTY